MATIATGRSVRRVLRKDAVAFSVWSIVNYSTVCDGSDVVESEVMFHLFKASRVYEGRPYCGPTSNGKPAQYKTRLAAVRAANRFLKKNPVGWSVYYADVLVYSTDGRRTA